MTQKIAWNKGKYETHLCKGCNKQLRKWQVFCSHACYVESRPKESLLEKKCETCGKRFQVKFSKKRNKNCSVKCGKIAGGKLRSKKNHPFYGKKHTKESIMKMRIAGSKNAQKQQISKVPTSIEKIVYEHLKEQGIIFETQELINGKFLVDAYIPSLKTVIEVDGDYWHSLDRVMKKDKAENAYLAKCGYKIIRLAEHEVRSGKFIERLVL